MKCLVTGGAGFIGSHLVDSLLQSGNHVTVIDNFSFGSTKNLPEMNRNLTTHKADICSNLDTVFKQGIDLVFHLAALSRVQLSIQNPEETHRINVDGTLNILSYCRKYEVKGLIFASSSSVYGDQKIPLAETTIPKPISPYGLQKLTAEHYCNLFYSLYGLPIVNLRFFNVFGPRQDAYGPKDHLIPSLIHAIKTKTNPVIYGDGRNTRDFTYISDVVRALVSTANANVWGETINIGAGKNISVNHVWETLLNISSCNIKAVYKEQRKEPKDTLSDNTKSKELLKWKPQVTFEEGLKKTYE